MSEGKPLSDEIKRRREHLRQILVKVLEGQPNGLKKSEIWNVVTQKIPSSHTPTHFGLKRFHDLFLLYADDFEELKITDTSYVKLKRPKSDQIQERCIKLKDILCKKLQETNKGKVKISLFWKLFNENLGKNLTPSDYGVQSFPDLLKLFSDVFKEVKVNNEIYVELISFGRPYQPDLMRNPLPIGVANPLCQLNSQVLSRKPVSMLPPVIFLNCNQTREMAEKQHFLREFPSLPSVGTQMSESHSSLEMIKQNIILLLTENKDVSKTNLWNLYKKKYSYLPSVNYSMSEMFDEIEEFEKNGKTHLRLKTWTANECDTALPGPSEWGTPAKHPSKAAAAAEQVKVVTDSLFLGPAPSAPFVNYISKPEPFLTPLNFSSKMKLPLKVLESTARECIDCIFSANEFVSLELIQKLFLQRLSRKNLSEVGLRNLEQLPLIKDHIRLLCKVNAYIQAFVNVRSICTLKELEKCLSDYICNGAEFQTLKLGPLQKFPVVYDLFKFPPEEEITDITTLDILQHLRNYMSSQKKWMEKLDMQDVMSYLVVECGVEGPYHLGVRLRSLPLAVGVLKRAQKDDAACRKTIFEEFNKEVHEEIKRAFDRFQASILQSGEQCSIRLHYLSLSPEEVIMEIFHKFSLLLSIEQPASRSVWKHQKNLKSVLNDFLNFVKKDEQAKMLLHVAVCVGRTELEEAAVEILAPPKPEEMVAENVQLQLPPAQDQLLENLKMYLDHYLKQGTLTLTFLDRIEAKLLKDYNFPTFTAMGYGRFLHFLLTDSSAKKMLGEAGGNCLGSPSSSAAAREALYQPQLSHVFDFINQCELTGPSQISLVEAALCRQYGIKDIKQLGLGNSQRLFSDSKKAKTHEITVVYEAALCVKSETNLQEQREVGILGHQTKEVALAFLHNCPFLDDIAAWSHWSMIFEPQLGKLKNFIEKYGGVHTFYLEEQGIRKTVSTDVVALEIPSGKLLKLVSQTSAEKFLEALTCSDISGTCGHLVSIIVHNKGLETAPLALLANHMKTVLYTKHGAEPIVVPGAPPAIVRDEAVKFVLDCLVKLPHCICVSLANQIFLEPLGKVIGLTKSKGSLWKMCEKDSERNRLEELGYFLGISEWTQSLLQAKGYFPLEIIHAATADLKTEMDFDSEEKEEEDMESDSESIFDFKSLSSLLSDEEIEGQEFEQSDEKDEVVEIKVEKNTSDVTVVTEEEINESITAESDEDVMLNENKAKISTQQKEIEFIRREEFGIGVELNEDGQKLISKQNERVGRSLHRLSTDLYSKNTHFVLELIQNADDNEYPDHMFNTDSAEWPLVKFVITRDSVVVLNNENGFQNKDIRALCDIGKSTKGKHKFGYIGEKGIGFKSVFRVTDCPEVHSNGYHFYFDVNSGPMGYILPHWIEDAEENKHNWMTKITLPLKQMMKESGSLAASFNDIHPSLLLFLHRLRQIIIDNKVENSVTEIRRFDYGNDVIEICHRDGNTDRWLVVRKLLDASKISQAKSDVEVESTEIALAFPLKPHNTSLVLPPKQPVFAFLPLRSYGFRFVVQGDFDLPSSREDLDKDSYWNQWLKNEIPLLFLEVFDKFKVHTEFRSVLEAVAAYLQFVPMEDEILDFFKPVASHLLKKLRAKACIPTQPMAKGEPILWKLPSQTIIAPDLLAREVVTPDLLQKHLNLFYMHSTLTSLLNSSLTKSLGIDRLTTEHLLRIGQALASSWHENSDTYEKTRVISKWLACVYRSLDDMDCNDSTLSQIRSLKIIPLSTETIVALKDENSIFFPLTGNREQTSAKKKIQDTYEELHKDLNTVHFQLVNTEDGEINSQVQKLLLELGVKKISPDQVINHHILPILSSEEWKNKSEKLLVNYLTYIKEEAEKQPQIVSFEKLRAVAVVQTNQGLKMPSREPVHFTCDYGNTIDLEIQLSGYNWVLLDSCYLQTRTPNAVHCWCDFFTKLGVTHFLAVRQKTVQLNAENISNSPWAPLKSVWPVSANGYVIEDQSCVEFEALVNKNLDKQTFAYQMKTLCQLIDRDWDNHFSKFVSTRVSNGSGHDLQETKTSFGMYLQTFLWLPAIQNRPVLRGNRYEVTTNITFMQPFCLYLKLPDVEKVFEHNVFYVDATLNEQSSFCQFLKIKTRLNLQEVKNFLQECGFRKDTSAKPTVPCMKLAQIKAIYKYLLENLPGKDMQDLFHNHPVIFVPIDYQHDDDEYLFGEMCKRDEVWWKDGTGLFQKYKNILKENHMKSGSKKQIFHFYGDQEELFLNTARVQESPTQVELAEVILTLSYTQPEHAVQDILKIFSTVGKLNIYHDSMAANLDIVKKQEFKNLFEMIKKEKVFPTTRKSWVSLKEQPMIADNKELEKMFSGFSGVHFLLLEDKTQKKNNATKFSKDNRQNMENVKAFMDMCQIPALTKCITLQDITEMATVSPKLQDYICKIVPLIQQLLCSLHQDVYQLWKMMPTLAERMKKWKFYQVKKLEIVYSLNQKQDAVVVKNETCMIKENEFYIQEQHLTSYPEINKEVTKFFSSSSEQCEKDLGYLLSDITSIVTGQDKDRSLADVLEKHEVECLPSDEEPWEIPAPSIETLPQTHMIFPVPLTTNENLKAEQGTNIEMRGGGLAAWPPNASTLHKVRSSTTNDGGEKKCNTWPPPKPLEYMKKTSELPENIRMIPLKHHADEEQEYKDVQRQFSSDAAIGGSLKKQESCTSSQHQKDHSRKDDSSADEASDHQRNKNTSVFTENKEAVFVQSINKVPVTESRLPGENEEPQIFQAGKKRASEGGLEPNPKRPPAPFHFDIPLWNEGATELAYEELATGNQLTVPDSIIDPNSDDATTQIGKWGEALVHNYLFQQKELNSRIVDVKWMNKNRESGGPYDFELVTLCQDSQKVSFFIEVKSTVSNKKEAFEISGNEIQFALQQKQNFLVYRVFNAGSSKHVRLVKIENLAMKIEQQQFQTDSQRNLLVRKYDHDGYKYFFLKKKTKFGISFHFLYGNQLNVWIIQKIFLNSYKIHIPVIFSIGFLNRCKISGRYKSFVGFYIMLI